ncbi:MAG: RBBP9/YdeN family alpha/beta hydrolase [Nitrospiraceae bacterium]
MKDSRDAIMSSPVLILPGLGNSGPRHWQTLWEQRHLHWQRVTQRDWDRPVCDEWVGRLDVAVAACISPPVLVAHSLGSILVAHWASRSVKPVQGALLVALPDPDGADFPAEARGFAPVPLQPFAFPSIVVSSSDDPYGSVGHAKHCAAAWGSEFVEIGRAGHVNADSGLGQWKAGYALLQKLLAS